MTFSQFPIKRLTVSSTKSSENNYLIQTKEMEGLFQHRHFLYLTFELFLTKFHPEYEIEFGGGKY